MNLIKRTVILSGSVAEGYVTVIRVGSDVGAKIVGGNFEKGMQAGLKVGDKMIYAELEGQKTELTLPETDFKQNDTVGCAVISEDGRIIAKGGESVKIKNISEHFASVAKEDLPKEVEKAEVLTEVSDNITAEDLPKAEETVQAEADPPNGENADKTETAEPEEANDGKEILERLSAKEDSEFYSSVRSRVDELFVIYPKEEILNEYLPGSEWVKVKYDGEDYYVVGKLYEEGRTVLLGYGVPGKKNVTPPKIAAEIASWLSVPELKGYDGYWLLFQDANTGNVIPSK